MLTYQKCALHALSTDRCVGSTDAHHVIPIAWQKAWQPPQPWPYPGTGLLPAGLSVALWDARTIELAPTCHRNAHYWYVVLMRRLKARADENVLAAVADLRTVYGTTPAELSKVAQVALLRFQAAGGSLQFLISLGEFGIE